MPSIISQKMRGHLGVKLATPDMPSKHYLQWSSVTLYIMLVWM